MSVSHVAEQVMELKYFSGGERRRSQAKEHLEIANPATGKVIARVPFCTPAEVDDAVRDAADAFIPWRGTPVVQRSKILYQCGRDGTRDSRKGQEHAWLLKSA